MFFDFLIQIGKIKRNVIRGLEILPKPQLPVKQMAHFYTYEEILKELAFARMVEKGLADSKNKRTIGNAELKRRIRTWQK
jgi:hypothetical protein